MAAGGSELAHSRPVPGHSLAPARSAVGAGSRTVGGSGVAKSISRTVRAVSQADHGPLPIMKP
jgi:hypothetical protein